MFGHRQELYEWLPNQPVDPCLRTHHLLMQISSSDGMDWTWGDLGEIYFWITDYDLRQQRFDRVLSRIEGA
jgi:uncharacterized protein YwqG